MHITNLYDLANVLQNGPYAWPGGYPKHFVMEDGETCCFDCIKDNRIEVFAAAPEDPGEGPATSPMSPDPQWWPVGVEINWEDPSLYCAHCNGPIESVHVPHETEESA